MLPKMVGTTLSRYQALNLDRCSVIAGHVCAMKEILRVDNTPEFFSAEWSAGEGTSRRSGQAAQRPECTSSRILLLRLYPTSTKVQAFFFWNRWARKFFGLGYVDLCLTWIPFLRNRLLAPFKEELLADAQIGDKNLED